MGQNRRCTSFRAVVRSRLILAGWMHSGEGRLATRLGRFRFLLWGSASGHEDAFPRPMVSARSRLNQGTFARTRCNGRDAPTADVCDKGVFWKSPLRPRTMLSLRRPAFSAARPDQVNERAQSFAAPCELIRN